MKTEVLPSSTLNWLLEPGDPGVRYLALRDLLGLDPQDAELAAARRAAHTQGPIAAVLDHMDPVSGFWHTAGPGYNPKYFSSVWSIILLAQLGADLRSDARIDLACRYLLAQALTPEGQFSSTGAPSGTADCLQGNLCWALTELGCEDPRLETAYDWLARSVTGEGIAPQTESKAKRRYYAGKCGPGFACGANNKLPCAWGAAKVLLALGQIDPRQRNPLAVAAVQSAVEFLLGVDPATAAYPTGYTSKPNGSWWKFGFPVFYVADILQVVEALVQVGYGKDRRLANALHLVGQKGEPEGRWAQEHAYTGKIGVDFGPNKAPNKWVTLRAGRALQAAQRSSHP